MTRVRVGDVEIRTDADLTGKQLRDLLHEAAGIALALGRVETPEPSVTLGFTAHLERLADELAAPPE